VRRREVITLIGSAAAWPLAAHAQQSVRMRYIGVFLTAAMDEPDYLKWVGAFRQALQELAHLVISRQQTVAFGIATLIPATLHTGGGSAGG
jgi:hypothetical protein